MANKVIPHFMDYWQDSLKEARSFAANPASWRHVLDALCKVLADKSSDGTFRLPQLTISNLLEDVSPWRVSSHLRGMVATEELCLVEQGRGPRGSVYRLGECFSVDNPEDPDRSIDDIQLTTSREEENHWRIPRLHRVIGYVGALQEQHDSDALSSVAAMEDWKGVLTVKWLRPPEEWEKRCFEMAWGSEIGDCSPPEFVQHEMACDVAADRR